jgi:hypothetical protein
MKNFILLLTIFLLTSCSTKSTKIIVENTLDFDRNKEIVEVPVAGLNADFIHKTYILKDEKGTETTYQLLSDNQTLIFQATVLANASAAYTLQEGKPAPVAARTHVRFMPERSDDMAWENDIAAFRMYGPALMKIQKPSNGVDIWMKYKDEPVMDDLYAGELERKITYHEDNGLGGLDCYDVNHTLGAGGVAPYTTRLWIGDAFSRYEIVESGPLRSVFTLYYDNSIPVDSGYYSETLTITCDAGSPLNKGVVKYEGAGPIQVATGIFMDKVSVNTVFDKENRIIAYTKNAFSNKGVPQGQTYIGVYAPGMTGEPFTEDGNYSILNDYKIGDELTYYFGGGWSKWKFPTEQDWLTALTYFSQAKQNPLKITIN